MITPSWCQRLLCDCGDSRKRTISGIQNIPDICNLAGLIIQNGDHSTSGTVFTLKYADFYKKKRIAERQVYGGWGGQQRTGKWSALQNKTWLTLLTMCRCCNYSYRFTFTEDGKRLILKSGEIFVALRVAYHHAPKHGLAFPKV